jgi:hypothetical protein
MCDNTSYQLTHILEWVKIQGNCPVCQNTITENELIDSKQLQ